MRTQICLVSAQAVPNLIPTLDDTLKPERVILVTSPDMRAQTEYLSRVMKRRGLIVKQLDIPNAYDYAGIEDTLLNWLSENETTDVTLNVTGGTKLMAMAAQSVFDSSKKPIFYINIETDDIIFLRQRDQARKLNARIKLRDYLEANGYTPAEKPENPSITAALRQLADRVIDYVQSAGKALGQFNSLAEQAKNDLCITMPEQRFCAAYLMDIITLFEDSNLLTLQKNQIRFSSETARKFANGGWLEFHIHRVLSDLRPETGITDSATNMLITHPDGKTRNELDAAFLHRNRLHIIETKTANLTLPGKQDSKATEAIYKLESLLKLGGLRTRAMLIDYRGGLNNADKKRAEQSHIQVVSGSQLKNLKGILRHWLQ
ncbi:Card1-like endonuclease domain-containing protein [Kerstersia gyiorum]|uniref:Card1-like endonuclease domain-containing protein n=1 Tax=Kerstersia gyiorum TaxID=206506 RepID=UPI003B43A540